jgi:hypothetical protein
MAKETAPKSNDAAPAKKGVSVTRGQKANANKSDKPQPPVKGEVETETATAEAPVKKEKAKKEPKAKKEKVVKEKKIRTNKDGQPLNNGVSDHLRKIMKPTAEPVDGKLQIAVTYGEASKEIEKKFGRKLYPSEFDRNFVKMQKEYAALEPAVTLEKQPPRVKAKKEEAPVEAAPAAEAKPKKTKSGKKKVEEAPAAEVDTTEEALPIAE